ncbi:hypothetical protein RQP46_005792 [Phenoliferia psychrophenolica]
MSDATGGTPEQSDTSTPALTPSLSILSLPNELLVKIARDVAPDGGRKAGDLRLVCRHLGCVLAPVTWASIVLPSSTDALDELTDELLHNRTGNTSFISSVRYEDPQLQLRVVAPVDKTKMAIMALLSCARARSFAFNLDLTVHDEYEERMTMDDDTSNYTNLIRFLSSFYFASPPSASFPSLSTLHLRGWFEAEGISTLARIRIHLYPILAPILFTLLGFLRNTNIVELKLENSVGHKDEAPEPEKPAQRFRLLTSNRHLAGTTLSRPQTTSPSTRVLITNTGISTHLIATTARPVTMAEASESSRTSAALRIAPTSLLSLPNELLVKVARNIARDGGRKAGNFRLVCRHLGRVLAPVTWASIVLPTGADALEEIATELLKNRTGNTQHVVSDFGGRSEPFSLCLTGITKLFRPSTPTDLAAATIVRILNWVALGPLTFLTLRVTGPFCANDALASLTLPRVQTLVLDFDQARNAWGGQGLEKFKLGDFNQLVRFFRISSLPSLSTLHLRGAIDGTGVSKIGITAIRELPEVSPLVYLLLGFLRMTTVVELRLENSAAHAERDVQCIFEREGDGEWSSRLAKFW